MWKAGARRRTCAVNWIFHLELPARALRLSRFGPNGMILPEKPRRLSPRRPTSKARNSGNCIGCAPTGNGMHISPSRRRPRWKRSWKPSNRIRMAAFGDSRCRVLDFGCQQDLPQAPGVLHPSKDEGRLTILHRNIYLT